ncbi:histidine kinase [Nostoc sp.]
MPHAPCPMPNAQCPMPNECPMPNAQCPMPSLLYCVFHLNSQIRESL